MRLMKSVTVFLAVLFAPGPALWAQGMMGGGMMGSGMMGSAPPMWGLRNPVVGSGAEYKITTRQMTMDMTDAIVGKESVDGQPGYWLEVRMNTPQGKMIEKMLMVFVGNNPGAARIIMQMDDRPPIEPPSMMTDRMKAMMKSQVTQKTDSGTKVGTETISVPAGTFLCDHYRHSRANGATSDYWVSAKVGTFGVVKYVAGDMTMVLEKTLSNQTSEIHGTPQQMPSFPR